MTLAEVAQRAVREHERRVDHDIALRVGDLPADAPVVAKIGLYRVLQEALSNASRHAGGAGIEVELSPLDGAVCLEVRDRGPGFDAGAVRPEALGIAGMRERAELLGGTFAINPRPDGGTAVRLTLPLREAVAL